MEKKFTLMKTLTAFLDLLFSRRKNPFAVNNLQTSTKGGYGTGTKVNSEFIYVNDAKQADASFLFFEQASISDQGSTIDAPIAASDERQSKNKEESKKVNGELAQRNVPKPVHKHWRERVNDDLAACSPVVSLESVIVSRESITISDEILKKTSPTSTTTNKETRTNKNDAFLPFASFCFIRRLIRRNFNEGESFSVGGLFASLFSEILMDVKAFAKVSLRQIICQPFVNAGLLKNQKPALLTIPIRSKETRKPNYNDGIKL